MPWFHRPLHRASSWRQRGAAMMLFLVLILSLALVGIYASDRALTGFYRALWLERRTRVTYLAEAGMHLGLRELSGRGGVAGMTMPLELVPPTSATGGYASATLLNNTTDPGGATDTDGIVIIRSTGFTSPASQRRVIEATVGISPAVFPQTPGAIAVGTGSSASLGGNTLVSGYDALLQGVAVAGIALETPGQTVETNGSVTVTGVPDYEWGSSEFSAGQGFDNEVMWFVEQALNLYSAVHISGNVSGNLGTASAPRVTVVDPGASASLTGGTTGVGILIVQGELKLAGRFEYTGIIVVDGDALLEKNAGTADIYGGVVVLPADDPEADDALQLRGTVNLTYSQSAINLVDGLAAAIEVHSYVLKN